MTCHWRRWRCSWCRNESFLDKPSLKAHLLSIHNGAINEAQIPLILESAEEGVRYFNDSECPLCDEWDCGPSPEETGNWREFRRHLGRHMQQLAIEAIPLSIEGLEIRDIRTHLDATGDREVVYCHSCSHEWYRDEHGLECPECGGDITEVVGRHRPRHTPVWF
jgi:hypothetical protein